MSEEFHGAKAAVLIGGALLVYRRDLDVVWPGYWDFPGGGREGAESPEECVCREIKEEFGLDVPTGAIRFRALVPAMKDPVAVSWFFGIELDPGAVDEISFGDEGQAWALMAPRDVASLPNLVPGLLGRLTLWLRAGDLTPI